MKPNANDLGDLFVACEKALPHRHPAPLRAWGYQCRLCGQYYAQTYDGRGSEAMLDHAEAHREGDEIEAAELRRALRSDPNINAGRGRVDIRGKLDD